MTQYEKELIQVAAVAVAMLQAHRAGSTEVKTSPQRGVEGRILCEVVDERERQEKKWGTRRENTGAVGYLSRDTWYVILGEEFGEVGRAILERQY